MPQGEAIHLQWAVVPFIVHYIYVYSDMDEMEWLFLLLAHAKMKRLEGDWRHIRTVKELEDDVLYRVEGNETNFTSLKPHDFLDV